MLIKRLPWISACALILVMSVVISVTRTAHARVTAPCGPTCLNAENWAWAHCYAVGCAPASGNWFTCNVDGSGVGSYSYHCLCNCGGHQCATGDNGTIDPSCPPL